MKITRTKNLYIVMAKYGHGAIPISVYDYREGADAEVKILRLDREYFNGTPWVLEVPYHSTYEGN